MTQILKIAGILIALISTISCSKKTSNAVVPKPLIDVSEISGMRIWHGKSYYSCWQCWPTIDSSSNVIDTFGWVYINDSILAKEDKFRYGFNKYKRTAMNDSVMVFYSFQSSNGREQLTYYYNTGKMEYTYSWRTSGNGYKETLYTP